MPQNRDVNVAVVYTHFPHYRSGVFDALCSLDGYNFHFYYDPSGIEKTIESGVARDGHRFVTTRKFGAFYWQSHVIKSAFRGDFDVYIFLGNPFVISTWLAALILRFRGRFVGLWTHGWLRRESGLKGIVRNAFYGLAHRLLVYGHRAREIGIASGFEANRIFVIGNSLNYSAQVSARNGAVSVGSSLLAKYGVKSGQYFLVVSRLVPSTGIEEAIEALSRLKESRLLVVIGAGPERMKLEATAKRLDVDVIFVGAIYDELELAAFFMNSLAVVSPRKIGLLALHALAYGAPIVTHDDFDRQMPEVEAIEKGATGVFFKYGDRQDLAEKLALFIDGADELPPADLRREIAIKKIEREYTPEAQAEKIRAAIASLG